jgi:hypothetical protein
VDKFFKTLAKLASSSVFSLAKSENNWPKLYKGSVSGEKKNLARLVCGFTVLLANPEFYSHLASGYSHPCTLSECNSFHVDRRIRMSTTKVLLPHFPIVYGSKKTSISHSAF